MTKTEYFERLRKALADLPEADVKKTLDYYEELAADAQEEGKTEEESISSLPSPEDIAAELRPTPVKRKKLPWMKYVLVLLAGFAIWTVAQKLLWKPMLSSSKADAPEIADKIVGLGSDILQLGDYKLTSRTVVYKLDEITSFDIDTSVLKVKVTAERRADIEITWYDCEEWRGEAELSDGEFSLEYPNYKVKENEEVDIQGIIIRVPLEYEADYEIDANLGSVKISGCTGNLDISADMGSIEISDCTGNLTATSVMGEIDVSGCKADALDLDCSMGGISLKDTVGKRANLICNMGLVELGRADYQELELMADSGMIKGTLAGTKDDYTVNCNVGMGSSNLKSGGNGSRTLTANCDLGKVSLGFAGQN